MKSKISWPGPWTGTTNTLNWTKFYKRKHWNKTCFSLNNCWLQQSMMTLLLVTKNQVNILDVCILPHKPVNDLHVMVRQFKDCATTSAGTRKFSSKKLRISTKHPDLQEFNIFDMIRTLQNQNNSNKELRVKGSFKDVHKVFLPRDEKDEDIKSEIPNYLTFYSIKVKRERPTENYA